MILQALLRNATDAMRESRVLEIINTVRHYSYMYWQNIRWLVGPDMPLWQYIFQIISWLCIFQNLIQVVGTLLHFRKFSVENIHGTLDCWSTAVFASLFVSSYMYCFENLTLVLSALLNLCATRFYMGIVCGLRYVSALKLLVYQVHISPRLLFHNLLRYAALARHIGRILFLRQTSSLRWSFEVVLGSGSILIWYQSLSILVGLQPSPN